MVEAQKWNPEIQKTDYPYQVVGKYFGAKSDGEANKIRNSIVKDNADWLARMAGVKMHTGTKEQNLTIADRLRKNDVEPFYEYKKNTEYLSNFSKIQECYQVKNLADQRTFEYYIANLDQAQIAELNQLSPEQAAAFIGEACQHIDQTQMSIQNKMESDGQKENKNLAAIKEVMDMQQDLQIFIKKYSGESPAIARFTRQKNTEGIYEGFADATTEQEFQAFFDQQKVSQEGKAFVKEYGEEVAKEHYRQIFIIKHINAESLSASAKKEFAGIVVNIYEHAKKFGIDLVQMGLDMVYEQALRIYQSTEMSTQLSNNIMADPQFNAYFDQPANKVEKLVPDTNKNLSYYKNLIKLYPETDIDVGNGKKISEIFPYLNEDLSIKDTVPENIKKTFPAQKELLIRQAEHYETKLLNRSNALIQQSAIQQCITALQKTMNIDIDEGKNVLDQFVLDKDLDTVIGNGEQLLLNIKGNIDGKRVSLAYDITNGKVYYQKYLQKNSLNDLSPIQLGATEIKESNKVPCMVLPSLQTVIQKGKDMAQEGKYAELMQSSKNITSYDINVQEVLKKSYKISETISNEVGKDMIKKNILEDMIIQKMMKIGERDMFAGTEITSTQYSDMYTFYDYIYKSFAYCDIHPMVQLEDWNTCMNELLITKEAATTTSSDTLITQDQGDKSQERFVLHALVNQKVMGLDNTQTRNQNVESRLLPFFRCFEKNVGGMQVVDVEMMNDFFKATKRAGESDQLGKRKKNENFNTLYRNLHSQMGQEIASRDLDKQLQMV